MICPSLASLSRLTHSNKIQNGDDIWPNLRRFIYQFIKFGGIKTWKELTIGVQQLVRLLLNNILSTPTLSFNPVSHGVFFSDFGIGGVFRPLIIS